MNGHLQRGLPPTPGHVLHFDPSRPPPTPKEMYSQGMYASMEDQSQYDHRRNGPPPPKRNPDTRLSTTSPRSSVGCYDEIHVQESPVHHHGNQQLEHHYGNQSPRHTSHESPDLRSKAGHDPPSSSLAGNRPFSYGAPILSPNVNRAMDINNIGNQNIVNKPQNGHSQQNVPTVQNYQYNDRRADSPVMHYGKHESAFHPQSHMPAPHELPPPVPPGHPGQGHQVTAPHPQYPQSPIVHRHSDASLLQDDIEQSLRFRSPKHIQKLSQRSKSVPCNPDEAVLPEPPPPLSVRENYLASALHTNRAPSPPLPPPPPEMLDHVAHQSQPAVLRNIPQNVDNVITSLPNVATSMSPKHQAVLPPSHQTNIPLPHHMAPPPPQTTGPAPPPPPQPPGPPLPPSLSSMPKKKTNQPGVPAIPKHDGPKMGMGRTGERAGGYGPEPSRGNNIAPVSPPRLQKEHSLDQTALMQQINKVQLKKTGIQAGNDAPLPEPLTEQPEAPPPASNIPPEPMAEPQQPAQVTPAVNMFEKKVDIIARADNQYRKRGDTSNDSRMDIDNIDLNDVPGYMPITKSTPIWKRDMIEKKNQEKLEEYIDQKRQEKEVAEKWKNVPEWKRKLMMEKEKEKSQKSVDDQKKATEDEVNKKRRVKEADDDRKTRIREQQEMEKRMQEELQDVPEWKREIMMKRGGAIKNWADEREDQNVQVEK